MRKISARRFRYALIVIASVILLYDVYSQFWLGALSMVLLIVAMVLANRKEVKGKIS